MSKTKLTEVVLLTKSYNLQDFKDWLHWHLDIIGFDCVHVFDNESSVDIKSVCDSYRDRVTYEKVVGWPNQYALYNRYINNESPAWWVLPIDDDEFLYVSDKYHNNINEFFLENEFVKVKHIHKLCIGWRNMFPKEFKETRNCSMIENATGWSNEASMIWQQGNRPVKTFVNTCKKYDWADKLGKHKTHNPFTIGQDEQSYTLNGEIIDGSWQKGSTIGIEALILYHYQFRSNSEWIWKCKNRKSPASRSFNKDHPDLYKKLYSKQINEDFRMMNIWSKQI